MAKTSPFFGSNVPVGIFGGTFNPPHLGHLRLAEEVAGENGLSRIIFIPSHIPPHKSSSDIASPGHRLKMTQLACSGNELFEVSDMEISSGSGPSYTVTTLERLSRNKDLNFFFIIGTDSLQDIHTWKDYEHLFSLSNFIVVTRPGTGFPSTWANLPETFKKRFEKRDDYFESNGMKIIPSSVRGLDISATNIRRLIKSGKSIRYLVAEPVYSYIMEQGLYRNS
jgi:nicotinate-nucleotide adenylyltransferase